VRAAVARLYRTLPGVLVVQEYVHGLDVTVPVIGRRGARCLPAVELRHDRPVDGPFVFDAERKHTKSRVHYAVPDWPAGVREEVYAMAAAAVRLTGVRDFARMDCRVTADGRCFFLEVNANPQLGLGPASFAVSAASAGLTVAQVVQMIVEDEAPPWGEVPPG
jgi:D-alanine-D-alanine ligase